MAHSFHIFVADRLAPLAEAAGISGHELVGKRMIGGSSGRQHWDLPDEKNVAKAPLDTGDLDVLTMSPNWRIPDDGVDLFVARGLRHNPDLRVFVQLSWMSYDHWQHAGDPPAWDPARMIHRNSDRDARPLDGLRKANANTKAVFAGMEKPRGGPAPFRL